MKEDIMLQEILRTIGNNLYEIRHKRKEKITAVAQSIGVSHPVISRIENGRYKSLSIELLYKLSVHYMIKPEDIISKKTEQ